MSPLLLFVSAVVGLAPPAAAQERVPGRDPDVDRLLRVGDSDPLELARLVARVGDDAITRRLGSETGVEIRLAAIRATPFLAEPELALPHLADIARGRDPDLAPASAQAAMALANRLDADDLVRREVGTDVITGAIEAFRSLAHDESCRRDLRRAGFMIVDRLRSLLSDPAD